ncbi:hypothetical protein CSB45_05950 [candidate division KSB3 bacterium]|uniref:AdoMet activation domain-containing protein n=1 Tax=candidate division KSB3 bacterium TaxID=2044937 RepID=A0A2G6E761_9BACT|nr:MAG: hypothetical protein CSB45_05950 [candidate division KSB3 bacterium]PIE30192.1 MAG: hypothetical protein CSA57_04665 [candidate division KSB3 bacterium]
MQMLPVRIQYIPVEMPVKRIYSRMGFRKLSTKLSEKDRTKIDAVLQEGLMTCSLSGVYVRKKIVQQDERGVTLEGCIRWESLRLAKFLANAEDVFLIGATAGQNIVDLRERYLAEENTYHAVILDAFASEMVESAVQWIHDYLARLLRKELKTVTTRRYSPGYGDFSLDNQLLFSEFLDLETTLGVRVSDRYLLLPEKSVTAVVGILPLQHSR